MSGDVGEVTTMTPLDIGDVVRHVGDDDLPWADASGGIELKVLRVEVDQGIWVVRNRFQPGVTIPTHRHTGGVHGFTLSGRWHYKEYDFVNTAGSFIREPSGSVHTLTVPEDNTDPTDVLFIIEGAYLDLDANGQVSSVIDGPMVLAAYEALCEQQGFGRPTGILN